MKWVFLLFCWLCLIGVSDAKPATSGAITLSGPSSVVAPCPNLSVSLSYQLTKGQGQPLSTQFSVMGLPAGLSASFSPTSCKPNCTTTLALRAASDFQQGNYNIAVKAQNANATAMINTAITPKDCSPPPPPPPPPSAGWYGLQPDSIAIDSGIYVGVNDDINGTPRPAGGGFDIGAVERT